MCADGCFGFLCFGHFSSRFCLFLIRFGSFAPGRRLLILCFSLVYQSLSCQHVVRLPIALGLPLCLDQGQLRVEDRSLRIELRFLGRKFGRDPGSTFVLNRDNGRDRVCDFTYMLAGMPTNAMAWLGRL